MAHLVSKNDSDMIDDLVIDSDWCEEVSPKGLVYDGTYQKTGAPRCDVLYGDRSQAKRIFRDRHDLPEDAKVLLFAPTFKEYKNPDVQDRIIDESQADDMYEILAGMDAYISDYSSACFEAGFAHIPVFLYADDIQKYANDRGALMWNIATDPRECIRNNKVMTPSFDVKLPFTLAGDNDQLEKDIIEFDQEEYDRALDEFHKKVGLVFEGNASEKLTEKIVKIIDGKNRK